MFAQMLDNVESEKKTAHYATSRSELGRNAAMDSEHLTLRSEEERIVHGASDQNFNYDFHDENSPLTATERHGNLLNSNQ